MTEIQFTLTGNLVSDPELRYAPDSSPVINLAIAVTPRIKRDDSYVDGETTFIRGALWGQYAENVAESLAQGQRVHASGILRTRKYADPTTGEIKSVLEAKFNDISPDLRFATVKVTKATRTQDRPSNVTEWLAGAQERAQQPTRPDSRERLEGRLTDTEYHEAMQNLRTLGAQPVGAGDPPF